MKMKRRDFLRMMPLGALSAGGWFWGPIPMQGARPGAAARPSGRRQPLGQERTSQLYRDALVIDALVKTRDWSDESWRIATQAGYSGLGTSLSSSSMEAALRDLETWNQRIERDPDRYLRADSAADFGRAHATGKLAILDPVSPIPCARLFIHLTRERRPTRRSGPWQRRVA